MLYIINEKFYTLPCQLHDMVAGVTSAA